MDAWATYNQVFGALLTHMRGRKSQQEVADLIGVTQSTIAKVERGASLLNTEHLRLIDKHVTDVPTLIRLVSTSVAALRSMGVRVVDPDQEVLTSPLQLTKEQLLAHLVAKEEL